MGMRKLRNKLLGIYTFCLTLSFVCITISSKFSFLYAFHDVSDVQCFITVARCMLRGNVLYRDVYEHKGPLHYFLYYAGMGITSGSTIGIYVIETILFSVFLFAVYKTIELFCKYSILNYAITTLIGVWATVRSAFCGGGQCEELTLPFIALALYFTLREYAGDLFSPFRDKETNDNNHNGPKVWHGAAAIGLCFAVGLAIVILLFIYL